jgi:hypothetical protein
MPIAVFKGWPSADFGGHWSLVAGQNSLTRAAFMWTAASCCVYVTERAARCGLHYVASINCHIITNERRDFTGER